MFIREKLFSFKMNHNKNLDENLDEFKKLTNALNQIGEKLGVESEAAILINPIHDTYKEVKTKNKTSNAAKSLFSKGKKCFRKTRNKNQRSSRDKPVLKCFICHKGHVKRNCLDRGKELQKR